MDADFIRELFSEFGAVQVRRMFGGTGLFVDGLMFGLVLDEAIYLKADADTVPNFVAESCEPFGYSTKHGRRVLTPYWRLPDRLYDDPEGLARWARTAHGIARAKAVAKTAPKKPMKTAVKPVGKPVTKRSRTRAAKRVAAPASKRRKAGRPKARRRQ